MKDRKPLKGLCNDVEIIIDTKKGWFCDLVNTWIVKDGISNLLSAEQLQVGGFAIEYTTFHEWFLLLPRGGELGYATALEVFNASSTSPLTRLPMVKMPTKFIMFASIQGPFLPKGVKIGADHEAELIGADLM